MPSPRRLAEIATARPRRVLALWAVAMAVAIGLTGTLLDSGLTLESDQAGNPESKRAQQLIDQRLPGRDAVDEVIVMRSGSLTATDDAFRAEVRSLDSALRATGGVQEVSTLLDEGGAGLVSEDGEATMVALVLEEEGEDHIEDVLAVVQSADEDPRFQVAITGQYTLGRDFEQIAGEDLVKGELQFGLPAALLVLLLVFGTLVGAAIPLIVAFVSIVVALGVVAVVGQFFMLDLFITNMLVVMGLALGIDYSLFIVSRLREERGHGHGHREAILRVAGTATRAVVFSGCAFALALFGMFLVPDPVLRSLALGAIVVGVVAVAVALTFHPALLMLLGDRVDRLRVPWLGRRVTGSAGSEGRFWGWLVRGVVRRPGASLAVAVGLLLLATAPVLGLKLGASGPSVLPDHTMGKQGYVALERDFPGGAIAPVEIVVDTRGAGPMDAEAARLQDRLENDPGFGMAAASVERSGDLLVASVPLNAEHASEQATQAIDRLRDEHVPAAFGQHADQVLVGGDPAVARDYFTLIGNWLPVVIVFVLGLSFVLLTVAFRSVVIPLTAIAVNLLSVGAAYGLLVLVFQHGVGASLFGFGEAERIEAWVPVFLFSVLFGLSMDYQVFLLSRIRERYASTGDTTGAIVFGIGSTARLITGAALIIVVVFSGFATGSLVAFQQMGFGVAVALLIDATIVRSVVIPAAMQILGERNWYLPGWLERMPRVAIEGPDAELAGDLRADDHGPAASPGADPAADARPPVGAGRR
jgi:putative drug exporter of the RND superfamily